MGLFKEANWVSENVAQVKLSVFGVPKSVPVDVVLVLDVSGSRDQATIASWPR